MEDMGILDVLDAVDIFCLHYVSKDLVQEACIRFQRSWNCHAIRTEGNKSPNQLYIAGLANLKSHNSTYTELDQVWKYSGFSL